MIGLPVVLRNTVALLEKSPDSHHCFHMSGFSGLATSLHGLSKVLRGSKPTSGEHIEAIQGVQVTLLSS